MRVDRVLILLLLALTRKEKSDPSFVQCCRLHLFNWKSVTRQHTCSVQDNGEDARRLLAAAPRRGLKLRVHRNEMTVNSKLQ